MVLTPDRFSMDFTGFDKVYPNTVWAIHDYCGK